MLTVDIDHNSRMLAAASTMAPINIWHQRLAHLDVDRLKRVQQKGTVLGLLTNGNTSHQTCESCVVSKMTATQSTPRDLRAKQVGDVIHADLEFMGQKSFSGAEISLKFVDEYSNYV